MTLLVIVSCVLGYEIITGCSIPVVHTLRVRVDWVRFPAARPIKT